MDAAKTKEKVVRHGWREFACGAGSAFCNILFTYPIYKIIFRQMMYGSKTGHALDQIRNEGLSFLYRGMLPPLLQKTVSMSLMFGIYDMSVAPLHERGWNPYLAKATAGAFSGVCECSLLPFERIQVILVNPKYHKKFKNTFDAAWYIYKGYGIKEFYRGLTPVLIKNCPSNSFFFIMKDEAKRHLPDGESRIRQGVQNFLVGASIGAFSSTFFYPLTVIRINFQCKIGGQRKTIIGKFFHILNSRQNKLMLIYKGALLNISRSFLSWGIVNSSYEYLRGLLY